MNDKRLKAGRYIFRDEEGLCGGLGAGHIIIELKETDKSVIMRMVEDTAKYYYNHFHHLFGSKDKIILKKGKHHHPMRIWSETDFTIYPFQAGIPFYFTRMSDHEGGINWIEH